MTLLQEVFKKVIFAVTIFVVSGVWSAQESAFSFGKSKIAMLDGVSRPAGGNKKQKIKSISVVDADLPTKNDAGALMRFSVTNQLGRKAFVVPFAYVKRFMTDNWHWYKASVLELEVGQTGNIDFGSVPSEDDLSTVFGCVSICSTKEAADAATYQMTLDSHRIDFDLIAPLIGKGVVLHASKYGVEGVRLSYEVVPSRWKKVLPSLDFSVLNTCKHPIFISAFFYGKEQDCDVFWPWRFTKSPVYQLKPGESTVVHVETIKNPYDWDQAKGYLGIFKENEQKKAELATYELLTAREKIALGPLAQLREKQVVISGRQYGTDTVFDITTQPVRSQELGKKMAAS